MRLNQSWFRAMPFQSINKYADRAVELTSSGCTAQRSSCFMQRGAARRATDGAGLGSA